MSKVIELSIDTEEFRQRAYRIAEYLEQALTTLGPELYVAETLLALHILRRRVERSFRSTGVDRDKFKELLRQVEKYRNSLDGYLASLDAQPKPKSDA